MSFSQWDQFVLDPYGGDHILIPRESMCFCVCVCIFSIYFFPSTYIGKYKAVLIIYVLPYHSHYSFSYMVILLNGHVACLSDCLLQLLHVYFFCILKLQGICQYCKKVFWLSLILLKFYCQIFLRTATKSKLSPFLLKPLLLGSFPSIWLFTCHFLKMRLVLHISFSCCFKVIPKIKQEKILM